MAADGVQAYAKLQGESFVYYVQSLSLTLGRGVAGREKVDVDLGTSRSISRVHARIEYDFPLRQFVITPLGKNGIVIDGVPFSQHHSPIPLKSKSCVQIGDVTFFFLLPIGNISNTMGPLGTLHPFSIAGGANVGEPRLAGKVTLPGSPRSPSPADDGALEESDMEHDGEGDGEGEAGDGDGDGDGDMDGEPHEAMPGGSGGSAGFTKPPFSYATLISQAIRSTKGKKITLAGIYQFILTTFPYYRSLEASGWQNSIRHNLSLNKAFMRVPRAEDEPGKGAFWVIDPSQAHLFEDGIYKGRSRAAAARARHSIPEATRHSSRPRPRLKTVNTSPRASGK